MTFDDPRAGPDHVLTPDRTPLLATLPPGRNRVQRTGLLDSLLLDPGYLVNAAPAGLLAALPSAKDPDAQLAGSAYQRVVHHLRGQPEDCRFSYLELASRITHASVLASFIASAAPDRRWSVPWTHWPPEHPHRVLAGHRGAVNGVVRVPLGDGNPVVVSIGADATLRIWDLATAEPRATYTVGAAPLIAVATARLSDSRTIIVLLDADGTLHTWDMTAAARLLSVSAVPFWRRLARLRNADLSLRCLVTPQGQQFAVTGGRGIGTCLWELSSGRRVIRLPRGATPETTEFMTLIDGRTVIAASLRGAEYWLGDPLTGQQLPDERRRIPFTWLQSAYDRVVRGTHIAYYALPNGSPTLAARFFRGNAEVWDLAASRPLGTWRLPDPRQKPGPSPEVRLAAGQLVAVPLWKGAYRASHQSGSATSVIPFEISSPELASSDSESHGSASLRAEMRGRLLSLTFKDSLAKSDQKEIAITLAGHTADVTGYDWSRLPDGHVIVVTASRDGTVRRWDISSIRPRSDEGSEHARVAPYKIVSVPMRKGPPLGLTAADSASVALWDLRTGKLVGHLQTAQRSHAPLVPSGWQRTLR